MKLLGRLIEVGRLSTSDRCEMLRLMDQHYENVSRDAFEADLREKRWVIEVRDHEGRLQGFSTQMVLDTEVLGRPVKVLFSGDTIVDREHWGGRALTRAWGRFALSLVDEWPDSELYWFLISQGFRTYRFLPVFFREFFPRYDVPTPDPMQQTIDRLAHLKFSAHYDQSAGVVRSQTYSLRSGLADVTTERLEDQHVRFFMERNPGHISGDELCCIARLSRDNFTDAAYRVIGSE